MLVNRILIDEGLNCKDKITIEINKDGNYLLNNLSKKYILNVRGANVNILSETTNCSNLDITINIYNSNVVYNLIGYNFSNQNIKVNLNEKDSNIEIYNSIVSINKQEALINILHNAPYTNSNIYNFAATKDLGSIKFNVISKVLKGMKKCIVNQESKIISLNSSNENEINPILLIDEFDSVSKHSAFIGKFKEEEVFYMQTRGLLKKDAYNLLLKGFLIGKLKISDEEKENIIQKYDNWR